MAFTVDEINVLIKAQTSDLTKQLDAANKKLDSFASAAGKAGSRISSMAVAVGIRIDKIFTSALSAISSHMDDAISRLDTINNFPNVMSNLGIGAAESSKSIAYLSEKLQGLPTTLDDAALSVQRFTSANGNLGASTQMFLAVNNAILAGGTSMEIQSAALEQLSQAYAKGKPDMMEWRSLLTAMPAQLNQVATAMGYASSNDLGEALRNGEISMNDFMATIVKLNKEGANGFLSFEDQARNATGGVSTAIVNLKTAITRGLTTIMDVIGQSNIAGFFNAVASAIGTAANYVAAFVKVVLTAINALRALFGQSAISWGSSTNNANDTAEAVSGISSAADDATDSIGGTTAAAKKLKKQLASFDEMNVLTEQDNSSGGSGGGGSSSGVAGNIGDLGNLDFNWDEQAKKVDEIAERIQKTFENLFNNLSKSKAMKSWANATKKTFEQVETSVGNIFGSMRKITDTTFSAMKETATKYGDEIDKAFSKMFDGLGNLGASTMALIFAPLEGLLAGFEQKWSAVAPIVTDSMAIISISIAETIGSIAEELSGLIDVFVVPLKSGFENLGDLLATVLADWFSSTAEWLPQINEKFVEFFHKLNEGLFNPATAQIGKIWEDFTKGLKDWWDEHGKKILDGVGEFFLGLVEWFNKLWTDILEPIVKPFLDEFSKVWEEKLQPAIKAVGDFVGKLVEFALMIWNNFIHPIIMWLTETLAPVFITIGNVIGGMFNSLLSAIGGVVDGIFTALGGIIDFLTGVFTGNWEQAWNGVKSIFEGIANAIGSVFKLPINFVIDCINGFIRGINAIKIPDWVPLVGGAGFNIGEIPKLAKGGVINTATVAMVGEYGAEAIMPLEHNTSWISYLAKEIQERGGTNGDDAPTQIIVKIGEDVILDKIIDGINDRSSLENRAVLAF